MSNAYNTDGMYHAGLESPVCVNPFESIERAIAFDVGDWSINRRQAWIYGIIFGYDDSECIEEMKEMHGWDEADIERIKMLHDKWCEAKEMYEKAEKERAAAN